MGTKFALTRHENLAEKNCTPLSFIERSNEIPPTLWLSLLSVEECDAEREEISALRSASSNRSTRVRSSSSYCKDSDSLVEPGNVFGSDPAQLLGRDSNCASGETKCKCTYNVHRASASARSDSQYPFASIDGDFRLVVPNSTTLHFSDPRRAIRRCCVCSDTESNTPPSLAGCG